jgi:hypothetical protein
MHHGADPAAARLGGTPEHNPAANAAAAAASLVMVLSTITPRLRSIKGDNPAARHFLRAKGRDA